jgi:UDP-glucose 4-epimerase
MRILVTGGAGYIEDVDFWFELLEDRNLTTHTYNADIADKVLGTVPLLPMER